jgi:hypothetical protein
MAEKPLSGETWPVAPLVTYQVEHQDWCYGVTHRRCCFLDSIDVEECTCGASEAQSEIDTLADTVRVQRAALDRIEAYADWVSDMRFPGPMVAAELRRRIQAAQ